MAQISPTTGLSGKNIGPAATADLILRGPTWGLNFRREKSRLVRPYRGVEEELGMVEVSRVEYVAPKRESGWRNLGSRKEQDQKGWIAQREEAIVTKSQFG